MQDGISTIQKSRVAFLLLLAIGISLLFFWVIEDFVLTLVLAAILAGLAHPAYRQFVVWLRGRESAAAAVTVLLTLLIVIVPTLLLLGAFVHEAIQVSDRLEPWISEQTNISGTLEQEIDANPILRKLLPYQDQIVEKAGQLASRTASYFSHQLAAVAGGTAKFFMLLFVELFAMFYFLQEGPTLLDRTLSYTPLSEDDKERLLTTFTSVGKATLKGTLVIGIVQGGLAGLSFAVAGIKGAIFWGAVMAVLSIIPAVGTSLVWVPMVIYQAMIGRIGAAVGVGLWCAIVVGTVDNILRPLLVGRDTKMPDLLVLLTTLGGLVLFGAAGIVIGPIIGALFTTVWALWGGAIEERKAVRPAQKEVMPCEEDTR
jgi:predicted PurR-regulated permease PerM